MAWFIVRWEIKGEKKYAVDTIGIDDLVSSVSVADRQHASIYQPVNYYTAEQLFAYLKPQDAKGTFLEVGCGKGRVLAMAAAFGFTDIIGIELSPKLCHEAIELCDSIEQKHPDAYISIECVDAREYDIPDTVSVIFLFNPFDSVVMADFLERVAQTLQERPRMLKVLYANPQCKQQWLDAGFKQTNYFRKMRLLEGALLENIL